MNVNYFVNGTGHLVSGEISLDVSIKGNVCVNDIPIENYDDQKVYKLEKFSLVVCDVSGERREHFHGTNGHISMNNIQNRLTLNGEGGWTRWCVETEINCGRFGYLLQSKMNYSDIFDCTSGETEWGLRNVQLVLEKYAVFYGCTEVGSTDWRVHGRGLTLRVDTSDAGFLTTPMYFTSLGGYSWHQYVIGASAIYAPDKDGFTVYITSENKESLSPEYANEMGWHINWHGIAPY